MNIEFYTMKDGEEVEVSTWREATHCFLNCDDATLQEDLLEAGMWLERHKRTIADYALYEDGERPWVEVYKAKPRARR